MYHSSKKEIFKMVCILLIMISLLKTSEYPKQRVASVLFLYLAKTFLSANFLLQICSFLFYFSFSQKKINYYYLNWLLIFNIVFLHIYYYCLKKLLKIKTIGNVLIKSSMIIKIYNEYKKNETISNEISLNNKNCNEYKENEITLFKHFKQYTMIKDVVEKNKESVYEIFYASESIFLRNKKTVEFLKKSLEKNGKKRKNYEDIIYSLVCLGKIILYKNDMLEAHARLLIENTRVIDTLIDELIELKAEKLKNIKSSKLEQKNNSNKKKSQIPSGNRRNKSQIQQNGLLDKQNDNPQNNDKRTFPKKIN